MPQHTQQTLWVHLLILCACCALLCPAHADEKAPAEATPSSRPLSGTCLPPQGVLHASAWPALKSLTSGVAQDIASEDDFSALFGCASGVDWTKDRLIVLSLENHHMRAIHLQPVTHMSPTLKLRFDITCGPGYDDGSHPVDGSHFFFAILVPASAAALDIRYNLPGLQTSQYNKVAFACSTVPASRPE